MMVGNVEKKPLVTVIVPAYKAENYVRDALNSVALQIYQNWEVLVVEDAWRDATESIVAEFAQRFDAGKVRFIRNPINLGLAGTRNVAIKQAKGDFVALLDHDDVWLPEYLEHCIRALRQENADVAYTNVQQFSETEDDLGTWGPTIEELNDFPLSLFQRNYITPSATIMRRSLLVDIGLFDASLRSCEDYDCWIRLIRAGAKFVHVSENLCRYRQHDLALTKNAKVMTETLFYVVQKHRDWSILPDSLVNARIADLYARLAVIYVKDDFSKALNLSAKAWWLDPSNLRYVKSNIKVVVIGLLNLCLPRKTSSQSS